MPGLLLILLIAVGFFLRVYKLGEQSYWIDEGFTYMQMEAVHKHGYPLLDSGVIDVKDVILPYFLQITRFFSTNPFWLRIIPALFGTASIYVVFLLARYLWSRTVGLFAAFLLTFSYWHIAWSRQLRPYSLLVLFIFITMLFLSLYERTGRRKYLVWALVFIVCAIASKSAGIILLVPFVAYLFLKKLYKLAFIAVVILVGGIFMLRHMLVSALGMAVVNYSTYYVGGYLWQYFGIIFFLAVVGWFLAIKNEKHNWRIHAVAGIFFLSVVVFFSFFVLVNQRRYMFFITPLLFMYAAYALALLSRSRKKYTFILVVLVVFDFFTAHSLLFLPQASFVLEDYTPQPNFKRAYKTIGTLIEDGDAVISAYPFMDRIYLGRSTFAIPISYTGREQDSTGQLGQEHYSGTPMLYVQRNPFEKYISKPFRKQPSVFVTIDSMSKARISPMMKTYIQKFGKVVFKDNANPAQAIWVYQVKLKNLQELDGDADVNNDDN